MLYKRTTNDHRNGELKNKDKFSGEQGWRSGESTRLPKMWPGFESWRRRHAWFKFVVALSSLPRGFSPGTPVLPLLQNQHFQIPIRSGTHGHNSTSSYELLSAPWVNTLQLNTIIHFNDLAEAIEAPVTPDWIVIHTFF